MRTFIFMFITLVSLQQTCLAQDSTRSKKSKDESITITSGIESNLLQFATVEQWNLPLSNVPRYTYFFNTGFDANFKIGNHVKLFTGLNVKNVGFIIKLNDSVRQKHRVYTFGAPFGFKLHSTKNDVIFKTGIDVSVAFNYKWKTIYKDSKTKQNEYFSNRTSLFFPSLFAGLSVKGVSVCANYYLNNFFNTLHPAVLTMDARLFTLGLGLNFDNDAMKAKKKKDKKMAS